MLVELAELIRLKDTIGENMSQVGANTCKKLRGFFYTIHSFIFYFNYILLIMLLQLSCLFPL